MKGVLWSFFYILSFITTLKTRRNRKNRRHGLCSLPAFNDSSWSMCHVLEHTKKKIKTHKTITSIRQHMTQIQINVNKESGKVQMKTYQHSRRTGEAYEPGHTWTRQWRTGRQRLGIKKQKGPQQGGQQAQLCGGEWPSHGEKVCPVYQGTERARLGKML